MKIVFMSLVKNEYFFLLCFTTFYDFSFIVTLFIDSLIQKYAMNTIYWGLC